MDVSNNVYQTYRASNVYMTMSSAEWPISDELKYTLGEIDNILYVKFGLPRTDWNSVPRTDCKWPSNIEWRWIINACYRRIKHNNLAIGLEFQPEVNICVFPLSIDTAVNRIVHFPLSDPNCFANLQKTIHNHL